jgi:hypothetical protein
MPSGGAHVFRRPPHFDGPHNWWVSSIAPRFPSKWGRCSIATEGASPMNAPPHRLRRSSPANGGAELQERRIPPILLPHFVGEVPRSGGGGPRAPHFKQQQTSIARRPLGTLPNNTTADCPSEQPAVAKVTQSSHSLRDNHPTIQRPLASLQY